MAFRILTNDLLNSGAVASAATGIDTTAATGYGVADAFGGPRSNLFRTIARTSYPVGVALKAAAAVPNMNYCVITRADYFITAAAPSIDIGVTPINSSGNDGTGVWTWGIVASSLTGCRKQDLVVDLSSLSRGAYDRGYCVQIDAQSTPQAYQSGPILFSSGFTFDDGPDTRPEPQWESLPDTDALFLPMRGSEPYETEKRITLTFRSQTQAKAQAFKALPGILAWPLYLYDEDAAVWPHKLEHVVVESWLEQIDGPGFHSFQITFRRLKHYGPTIHE